MCPSSHQKPPAALARRACGGPSRWDTGWGLCPSWERGWPELGGVLGAVPEGLMECAPELRLTLRKGLIFLF